MCHLWELVSKLSITNVLMIKLDIREFGTCIVSSWLRHIYNLHFFTAYGDIDQH